MRHTGLRETLVGSREGIAEFREARTGSREARAGSRVTLAGFRKECTEPRTRLADFREVTAGRIDAVTPAPAPTIDQLASEIAALVEARKARAAVVCAR